MKPGRFTQLYEQLVFAVMNRECLLNEDRRKLAFAYVSGILSSLGHKSLIVNGYSEHIHIFYGRNPDLSTSETVSAIKKSSAFFVNEQKWFPGKFRWQDGNGAFSYSRSQIDNVYRYIAGQEVHHSSKRFREEWIKMLKESDIVYDERFLFEFFDEVYIH